MRSQRSVQLARWTVLAALLAGPGCAMTMTTMDTARTTPVKHVRGNVGPGLFVPVGSIANGVIAAGKAVAGSLKNGQATLTNEEAEQLYEAALATALTPPAYQWEFQLRTGLSENVDAGVRYTGNQLRLDVKYRFYHAGLDDEGKSTHMSIGLGVSKFLFSNVVFEVLDYAKLGDFSRWDFEVPLLYSWEYRRYFVFYGGPKYIYTRFSMDENLYEIQKHVTGKADMPPITDSVDSSMHLFGGTIGLGGGWKYVWVYTELNAGYTLLRPSIYSFVDGQVKRRKLDGFAIQPAIGIVWKI